MKKYQNWKELIKKLFIRLKLEYYNSFIFATLYFIHICVVAKIWGLEKYNIECCKMKRFSTIPGCKFALFHTLFYLFHLKKKPYLFIKLNEKHFCLFNSKMNIEQISDTYRKGHFALLVISRNPRH